MKGKEKLLFVIFSAVCVLLISLSIISHFSISRIRHENHRLMENNKRFETLYPEIENKILNEQLFSSWKIRDDLIAFDPDSVKNRYLREVVNDHPVLILRISSEDCDVCIDRIIEQLKLIGNEKLKEKIILITDFKYPRQIPIFVREHGIEFKVLSLPRFEFGSEIDKFTPFYFIVQKDFSVSNLFFILHFFEQLNASYLELMVDKLAY